MNKSIISLLNEVIEASQTTNGVSSTMPTLIQDTIKMEACRGKECLQFKYLLNHIYDLYVGAIKFGDLLTKAQMSNFLDQLSKCKLPFQCAHGRPTVMPLLHVSRNVNTQVSFEIY